MKKAFLYILGAFMAFVFNQTRASTTAFYGVAEPIYKPTLWEEILSVIISPIVIVVVIILALVIGTVIFIKQKRKNDKKNS